MMRSPARGFALAEVMIAALMLALCAWPAANAIKNSLDAAQVAQTKAAELRCVRNQMETVMAEPYVNLNLAAGTTAYNLAADSACAARTVTLTLVQFDGLAITPLAATATDDARRLAPVKVQVTMAGATYAFTSVVAR